MLPSMPPRPLQLQRRRWTLVFSVPFTAFMALVGTYSVYLMITGDSLVMVVAGCGAFAALCIGGTVGKSVLEAWRNNDPAVIVDQHGLHDTRGATGFIPWDQIETVKLDVDEQRILINIATTHRRGPLASATRRLLAGADHTVALGGLSYSPRELAKALAEHHRNGKAGSMRNATASDA